MAEPYDLTLLNSTNARTYLDLVEAVNTSSSGLFGILMLALIFFVFTTGLRQTGLGEGLDNYLASSFLTSIFAGLLFLMGLLSWMYLMIPISLLIVLLMVKFMQ